MDFEDFDEMGEIQSLQSLEIEMTSFFWTWDDLATYGQPTINHVQQ
jgi:hypothetical protein